MQYDVKSAAEYLQNLESDWRKDKLMKLREMILQQDDNIVEDIEYKMLRFHLNGKTIFHLNAQKNYVSLYTGDLSKLQGGNYSLEEFDKGKGCLRVKKKNDSLNGNILGFIQQAVKQVIEGHDISC